MMPLESSMFIAYAAYLGGPTATSIIFYAWKSKAENVLKIGQSFKIEEEYEKTIEAGKDSDEKLFESLERWMK